MFSPDDIKKVLGKDEKSQKKLQELLNTLQKTKEQLANKKAELDSVAGAGAAAAADDASEEAPSSLQQNPDLRRKLLQQKLYAMKSKRMTNNAKTNMQEKIKKKILNSED